MNSDKAIKYLFLCMDNFLNIFSMFRICEGEESSCMGGTVFKLNHSLGVLREFLSFPRPIYVPCRPVVGSLASPRSGLRRGASSS